MTCSKLFSGDLPELINKVIQYFRYDYKTLYSCILVNRLWCRLAIPLLWEDPFLIKKPKNYRFIEIYLYNLNEDYKTKLNEYVNHDDSFPSNTLFNYPSFIQHLDTSKVCYSVEMWVSSIITKKQPSRYFIRDKNLSNTQILNLNKLICKSLFLIFIENEINLHNFEIVIMHKDIKSFDETFELILKNPNFIHNIKNLKFYVNKITENMTKFLKFLQLNCKSISSLYFSLSYFNQSIIEKDLSRIIDSQENLKRITFSNVSYSPLYHSLSSLKRPSCSNTLNTIIFYKINFKNIIVLDEVYNQLNVLESIHIVYCYSLDSKFFEQIDKISKPFKLKSLFLRQVLQIELLELLIQKSGNYLENIGMYNGLKQILPLITKYCSKIKYLGHILLDNQSIHSLFDLIRNITQNLNYLTIDFSIAYSHHYNDYDNISSIILCNLGQVLPFKLEYLNLKLIINISDFEVFLRNSQNTFIKKLLINSIRDNESENIYPSIKEYIMKKRRVKYLAVLDFFDGKFEDLFSLKDKVEEFQLHDIQILGYHHLVIDVYNFIMET
ncbi:hypothetical protein RclHR1_14670002 [Rhizophagus clarus]|uniref:F-box domain-containing protein n=1 Tax=Rhizophagus clarus TaxID=94130 RepID=A0A2Z6QDA1_9GLOM|nr:hypothetical protein RclHR1_14670002 [Rhizophagus clarus]GET03479.1 hypothetical protein GLOIN_2v1784886 [Rhizophagus clarus]